MILCKFPQNSTDCFGVRLQVVLRCVTLVYCVTASLHANFAQQALPGTLLLTDSGDLASTMIEGIDRFLLKQIDLAAEQRQALWKRSYASFHSTSGSSEQSPDAKRLFLEEKRRKLSKILGVVDSRVPFAALDILKTTAHSGCVAEAKAQSSKGDKADQVIWQAYVVRWPVLEGVYGEGLLLEPVEGSQSGNQVVVVPDAQQTPEQIAGLAPGCPDELQYAKILADSGCRVVVPMLISYRTERRGPPGKSGLVELSSREFVYRPAFELGRQLVGYEVQKILALVDWLSVADQKEVSVAVATHVSGVPTEKVKQSDSLAVVGYGEGGQVALLAAALDERITAAYISGYFGPRESLWQEPISRNLFGILNDFGDAQLAAMVYPRDLVIDFAVGPSLKLRTQGGAPGELTQPIKIAAFGELQRAVELLSLRWDALETEPKGGPTSGQAFERLQAGIVTHQSARAVYEMNSAENVPAPFVSLFRQNTPGSRIDSRDQLPDAIVREERQIRELVGHTQHLLSISSQVREEFMRQIDTESLQAFQGSIEPYRQKFRDEVIGAFDLPVLPPNSRSRKSWETDRWIGYEVLLDVWPDVVAYGVLLVPKDLREDERRPVVVCQHGLEGRPTDVFLGDHAAYHDFAGRLCDRGYIVFAPQNIYLFEDRFRTLQRKANGIGKTLFSIMIPQHQQIVDWLQTLPFVDEHRIAFYGLSYGGKSAMRIPALVPDYCLSICSADFNEWILKNASTLHPFSYVWTGEYEIFEFNLGNTFNYSEMAALICPRPFMVERGHFDAVGSDEWVAHEYAKVQRLYKAKLGLEGRVEIEWFNGPHTINGQATFEFLDRHLKQ